VFCLVLLKRRHEEGIKNKQTIKVPSVPSVCSTSGFEDRFDMKGNISFLDVPHKKSPQNRR